MVENAKIGLPSLVASFMALVFVAFFAYGYEITKFTFGPNVYTFSEPTIDFEKFNGNVQPIMVEETFAIAVWEGSDQDGDRWASVFFATERAGSGPRSFIWAIQISTGVTGGDPAKMKAALFVDVGYFTTGIPSFKLTRVENLERIGNVGGFVKVIKQKTAIKHQI